MLPDSAVVSSPQWRGPGVGFPVKSSESSELTADSATSRTNGAPPSAAALPPDDAVSTEEAAQSTVESLFEALRCDAGGLSSAQAAERLARYGPNALPERHVSALRRLLGFFWGPIPWMIEIAAVLSAVVRHWDDLVVITVLLLFNAIVGFWQEFEASNAVEALKRQLALKARVLRDGEWRELDAARMVPGDVVRVRIGDVIPADVKLLDGEYLTVDQAALTGESLPVEKGVGDVAYSGSVAKQGEMVALVVATGASTYFGRTAKLVSKARSVSHFQKAVLTIGDYLIYLALMLVSVLIVVQLLRGASLVSLIQFALILTVAAIPVAMPAVLSVTMAVGSVALSRMKAIVSRLESIEEMAGMDVLCADKTGTLTRNELTLGEPVTFSKATQTELLNTAALACQAEDQDPIDLAVLSGLENRHALDGYTRSAFIPFDPVRKRTDAEIHTPDGQTFRATKGAPQVVLELCHPDPQLRKRVLEEVDRFAAKGYRTLGVARTQNGHPRLLGLLPLFDPPRADSAQTIADARKHGIDVKMVTGDDAAIARETATQLGLGTNIAVADRALTEMTVQDGRPPSPELGELAEQADGFARVFPEHKFAIVRALQARGRIVGMTGDGVNDAPALKQADVGTAVSGATDAARAAADLVLTAPGLSVIVNAVEQARRIFERMNSYAIFRITETIRVMAFVVVAMIAFNFYPITAILIILLALFNDVPIMTIAWDNTWLDPQPVRWDMRRVLSVSTTLGTLGVIETFGLLVLAKQWLKLDQAQIQTLIFLKLAIAGHLTLFVARTRGPFYKPPYPAPAMLWSAISTKLLATVLVGLGLGLVTAISWPVIALVWGYCLTWIFIEDQVKLRVYQHLDLGANWQRRFIAKLREPLHPAG
jgi:H+-transporting ATPase